MNFLLSLLGVIGAAGLINGLAQGRSLSRDEDPEPVDPDPVDPDPVDPVDPDPVDPDPVDPDPVDPDPVDPDPVDPDPVDPDPVDPDPVDPDPVDPDVITAFVLSGNKEIGHASDVIEQASNEALQLAQATAALTFNADSVSRSHGILSKDASGAGHHFTSYIDGGTLYVRFQNDTGQKVFSIAGIEANRDYDLQVSFGNGQVTAMLDGAVFGQADFDTNWENNQEFLQVGGNGWASNSGTSGFTNVFDGTISDVLIVEGVQSYEDMQTLRAIAPDPVDPDPVDPDPVDPDPVDPDPVDPEVIDPNPEPPEQTGGDGSGGEGQVITDDGGTIDVMTGRVATIAPEGDDIVSVRILEGVDHGTVTVNPDNTLALVLTQTDFIGSMDFSYEVTHSDGSTSAYSTTLNVGAGAQGGGWGTGENHYMLETDADDRVIVEQGENHTKVYVSGSDSALSIADIAAIEGLSTSQITGSWLAAHPEYGQSEGSALAEDAGTLLWQAVTPRGSETSNWLLLERGYEYGELCRMDGSTDQRLLTRDTAGESEIQPLYIGAWGEGDRPEITGEFTQYQEGSTNVVIQDIHFVGGVRIFSGENMIFDGVKATDEMLIFQNIDGLTVRNSEIYDSYRDAPVNGSDWEGHPNRYQGMYADNNSGLLLEGLFFDHNGWADGYDPNGSGSEGQPPSMYSHNMYIDALNTDVTLRDTISMRSSAWGANIRSGAFVEDNVFLDNNEGVHFHGGNYYGAGPVGEYTLATDNVVTSGAHREADYTGRLGSGLLDGAQMTSLVDNIVAHLADPNNPDEIADKWQTYFAVESENAYHNDTIAYNWQALHEAWYAPDENIDGLNTDVLDQTTIQLFTAQLLGNPDATIADLADYLRAQGDGAFDDMVDADLIINFFQTGFGIAPDLRDTEATLRFIPNDLGDGVRWDNRLNWDSEDLPGTQAGDSVDLGGNHVVFGSNATIDTLDFGPEGALNVYGGKLEATGGMTGDGGHLNVEGAGQAWIGGSDGSDIDVTVTGGRFVNTGDMSGVDLTATGGQTVLATDGAEFDVSDGHTLTVGGSDAKVGFDGDEGGIAILDLHDDATLAFDADWGGVGSIEEFRTGAMGEDPNVQSGIDLGGANLSIDLSGLSAETVTEMMLMSSDELVGMIDDAMIEGLGARDATIMVDYEADTVTLELTSGSGQVSIETTGAETDVTDGSEDLWAALTADHGVVSESAAMMLDDEEDPDADMIESII